jgi:hypothetical protein
VHPEDTVSDDHPDWYQPAQIDRAAPRDPRSSLAWPEPPPPPPPVDTPIGPAKPLDGDTIPLPPPLQSVGPAAAMLRPQLGDPSDSQPLAAITGINSPTPNTLAHDGASVAVAEAPQVRVAPGGLGWNIRAPQTAPSHPWEAPGPGGLTPAFAGAGAPMPWDEPPSPARTTRAVFGLAFALRILLFLAIPTIGFLAWGWHSWFSDLFHTSHTISQPAKIGTLTPINDPALVAIAQNIASELDKNGASQAIVAYYGANGQPQLVLVMAKGSHDSQQPLDEFKTYAAGMSVSGFKVDTSTATDTQSNGTDFLCGPVSSPVGATLSTCMWDDHDVIGAVLDITGQPVGKTYTQAVAARAAGER